MTTERILPQTSFGHGAPSHPAASAASSAAAPQSTAHPAAERALIAPVPVAAQHRGAADGRHGARVKGRTPASAGIASVARLAKPRGDALFSTATRAGVLIGVSASVYAVSLAAVAGLQAQSQAQAAAAVQPALDQLAKAKAGNDEIAAALKDADARLQALTRDYDSARSDMTAYQARFTQLASLVAEIEGSAAAMNANFKLPAVTMRGAVGGGGGSTVVTTTTASGKP